MHPACDIFINGAAGYQAIEQESWVHAGDDGPRLPCLAARNHSGGAAIGDDQLIDRSVEQDIDARLAAGAGHGLSDRAHAADRMTPCSRNARSLSEEVMEQDISRAGRLR